MLHVHRNTTPRSCNQSLERWFLAIFTITHKQFVEPKNVTEIDGTKAMQTISLTSYICTLRFYACFFSASLVGLFSDTLNMWCTCL